MNTPAHLSIGLAVSLGVCAAVGASPEFAAGAGFASLVGSRAPDWDIRLEKLRRRLARLWGVGRPFRRCRVIHRGPTHWERGPLLAASGALVLALVSTTALAVTVGVLLATDTRLLGDSRDRMHLLRIAVAALAGWALTTAFALAAALGIGIGYAWHICADRCTMRGTERDPLLGGGRVYWLNSARRRWVSLGPWCGQRVVRLFGRFRRRPPKWMLKTGGELIGTLAILLAAGFAALLVTAAYGTL